MNIDRRRRSFERRVLRPLAGLRRRLRAGMVLDGTAVVAVAFVAVSLATLLVDRTFNLGADMRRVQLLTTALGLAALAGWQLRPAWRVPLGEIDLARLVERWHPRLRSRLISAVEFVLTPSPPPGGGGPSPALIEAVIAQAEEEAATVDFTRGLDRARLRRRMLTLLGCGLVFCLPWMIDPRMMAVWFRRNVLLAEVEWPHRNRLRVEGLADGRLVVPREEDITVIAAVVEGFEPPRQVFLSYRGQGGLSGRVQMPAIREESPATRPAEPAAARASVRFIHTIERIPETLHCTVSGGDAVPVPFVIEVLDRPQISQITVQVTPPPYTRLPPYELRTGQTVVEAPRGSRIGLRFRTQRPVVDARLVRLEGDREEIVGPAAATDGAAAGTEFFVEDQPGRSCAYYLRMTDGLGLTNISERSRPMRISVRLLPDAPPQVKLRIRGAGEMITADAVLPLEVDCTDNFGLGSVSLVCEVAGTASPSLPTATAAAPPGTEESAAPAEDTSKPPPATPVIFRELLEPLEPGSRSFVRSTEWAPGRRGLVEGDRLVLRAEAADLDDIAGPNVGRSAAWSLRIVSREELLAELHRREQEYRQDFERQLRQQEDLFGDMLTRAAASGASPPDPRTDGFAVLARRQRDYAGRVGMLRAQFEQLLAELRVNRLLTAEVEDRLGSRIVAPLEPLHRLLMPAAADALESLDRELTEETLRQARLAQVQLLTAMREILAQMLQWEGFQEAVALLREVQRIQRQAAQETENRLQRDILGEPPR